MPATTGRTRGDVIIVLTFIFGFLMSPFIIPMVHSAWVNSPPSSFNMAPLGTGPQLFIAVAGNTATFQASDGMKTTIEIDATDLKIGKTYQVVEYSFPGRVGPLRSYSIKKASTP